MIIVSRQNGTNNPPIELHAATINGNRIIALLRCGRQHRMIDASALDLLNFKPEDRLRAWNLGQNVCGVRSGTEVVA